MGRLFEPYVAQTLPVLLKSFSDGNKEVRGAAVEAAGAIMSQLSGHGVKLVLPELLKGIAARERPTKVGSIELLGTMAHCAPRTLAACLPQVVPALAEVVADSNVKVRMPFSVLHPRGT